MTRLTKLELETIKEQYAILIEAGSLLNAIYQNGISELISGELEKALDHLTAAHKFFQILLKIH